MKRMIKLTTLVIFTALLFGGCKKEDSESGPTGHSRQF
jgi:PBP1b-binding outer membrane lipoprotein LpoB